MTFSKMVHHEIPRGRRSARPAFTLAEMLVALTIGGLLVVSVVGTTRAMSTTRASVERRIACSEEARRAMETIVAVLRNVRRDPTGDDQAVIGQHGPSAEQGDRIDVLALSDRRCRPEGAESDQYEVSFFLERQADGVTCLMCRKDHALDEEPTDGGLVSVVAQGIVGLSFAYLSGEEWLDEWPENSQQAPEAVRIEVIATAVQQGQEPQITRFDQVTLSTVVALHVAPPSRERERARSEGGPK